LANADITKTINNWVTDNKAAQASFSAGECELLASVSGLTAACRTSRSTPTRTPATG